MEKIKKILLCISICILNINYLFYHTINNYQFKTTFRILSIILLILSIILSNKIKINKSLVIIILFLIFGTIIKNEQLQNMLFIILTAYSISINIEREKVIIVFGVISILTVGLLFFMRRTGIIADTITNYGGRMRNSLGFDNPNALSLIMIDFYCFIIMMFKKRKTLACLIVIFISYYINTFSDSRTLLFTTIIYLTLTILQESKAISSAIRKMIKSKIFNIIILTFFFISPFAIAAISKKVYKIDMLLSFRGTILSNYINSHEMINYLIGFSNIETIDNSFIVLFFTIGILGYLIIFLAIKRALKKAKNNNSIALIIMMLSYGMMESILIRPECLLTIYFWLTILEENEVIHFETK